MKKVSSHRSPVICYDILLSNESYHIDIYIEGYADSDDPHAHCHVESFCDELSAAEKFVNFISKNSAMPVHIPELAEDFLANI